jgi:hypothetical protein
MTEKIIEWRVSWFEGIYKKTKYYSDDYKAIKHHIQNLKKFGIMLGGAQLYFRDKNFSKTYVPVGGMDCLLGLTYRANALGKSNEYWVNLIQKAKTEVSQSEFVLESKVGF